MRAVDVVRKVARKALPEYVGAFESGDTLLSKAGINTPQRLAHFLAQVMHESGGLTIKAENMNYRAPRIMEIFGVGHHSAAVTPDEAEFLAGKPSALAERVYGVGNPKKSRELGNLNPGDGFKYRGQGILQTTGRSNYRRMGEKCGVNLETNPELVCSAKFALKPALAEWVEGRCNALADADDLRAITKKINGGYNGLADREAWYRRIRPIIDEVDFEFRPEDATIKLPVPPDVEPAPPVKPNTMPRDATAGTIIGGGLVAASQMPDGQTIAIVIAIAVVVGAAVIFLWPKRK